VSVFKSFGVLSLLLLCLVEWAGSAAAEPRYALVIGNGDYGSNFSKLTNPPNDAKLVSKALTDAGFKVTTVINANQKAMKKAVVEFGKALTAAGPESVGLFYYAGHGVQVEGVNYLIPTGAAIQSQADVDIEAVNTDSVLQQMEFAGNRMNIIILDACRNNPLPAGNRSAENGLARIDAPTGSFIAYSTAPGATAADGKGSNSPYSLALADAIEKQKVPLEQLFRDVRVNVMNATGQKQVPWDSSSLTGEFYFKKPDGSAPAQQSAALAPAPAPAPQPAAQSEGTSKAPEPSVAPGKVFRDCPDCPELVSIPPGSFTMGMSPGDEADRPEEKPAHKVTIKPFALMTKEVTRDQFAAFAKATGRDGGGGCFKADGGEGKWDDNADYMKPGIEQQGNHPVVCVSDHDAEEYAAWLSQKTGKRYRLPSEAEWEYAARAGKKTSWPWGNGEEDTGCKVVNAMDSSGHKKYPINEAMKCDDNFAMTAPVGSFPPNNFGLYDMLGNVWEVVSDCWHATYKGAPADGSSWEEDSGCAKHPMRGGAWLENLWDTRYSARWEDETDDHNTSIGFRLARDL